MFGENVSNSLQDIVLSMFGMQTRTHTHGCTGQNHYASSHTLLGGGIKITKDKQNLPALLLLQLSLYRALYYLCQKKKVIFLPESLCPSVCLLVDSKTYEWILMNFLPEVGRGPRTNQLD